MLKNHRRHIKRLSNKFGITIDEAIDKFYKDQKINKNVIFSINKKRNKGSIGLRKKEREENIKSRKIKNETFRKKDYLVKESLKIIGKPID
jgi:hypothetical protein